MGTDDKTTTLSWYWRSGALRDLLPYWRLGKIRVRYEAVFTLVTEQPVRGRSGYIPDNWLPRVDEDRPNKRLVFSIGVWDFGDGTTDEPVFIYTRTSIIEAAASATAQDIAAIIKILGAPIGREPPSPEAPASLAMKLMLAAHAIAEQLHAGDEEIEIAPWYAEATGCTEQNVRAADAWIATLRRHAESLAPSTLPAGPVPLQQAHLLLSKARWTLAVFEWAGLRLRTGQPLTKIEKSELPRLEDLVPLLFRYVVRALLKGGLESNGLPEDKLKRAQHDRPKIESELWRVLKPDPEDNVARDHDGKPIFRDVWVSLPKLPSPAAVDWMLKDAKNSQAAGKLGKRDDMISRCMDAIKCTKRNAMDAYDSLPGEFKRGRGNRSRA